MTSAIDLISQALLTLGCLCFTLAALGLFRMPDSLAKLHAGTKASALGILLLLTGAALRFADPFNVALCVGTLILIFLTTPLASHAIARRLVARED